VLLLQNKSGGDPAALLAQTYLRPTLQAAATIQRFSFEKKDADALGLKPLMNELVHQVEAVSAGNMARPEAMLLAQAHTLDAIFGSLARRAVAQEYLRQYETYMRLALKRRVSAGRRSKRSRTSRTRAQWHSCSRRTSQMVRNRSTIMVRRKRQRQKSGRESKRGAFEVQYGKQLDSGTQGPTGEAHSRMEAVGEINGSTHGSRQGEG
jgi:hypothetical protein